MYQEWHDVIHIALVWLLCPLMEKKDKKLSAHNQIDTGYLLSNILTCYELEANKDKHWPGWKSVHATA